MQSSFLRLGLILIAFAAPSSVIASPEYEPQQLSAILEPGTDIEEINGEFGTSTLAAYPDENSYLLFYPGGGDLEQLAELMENHPQVTSAQPNYLHRTPEAVRQMVIGAVGGTWADYQDQELTQRIQLSEAQQYSLGAGVTVAILDTGVDPNHQAFQDRLSPNGYDFIDHDAEPWETANGIDDDGDGLTDGGFGHGSMVTGIVALVAPESILLPIRIIDDEGKTTSFRIAQALLYASQHGADVIGMSFGVPLDVEIIDHFIGAAGALGAVLVAGAGNENHEDPPYFPAGYESVFMVTALDSADIKAEFADYHERVLISAPGVGVRSAYPGDEWGLGSGCSFATPFISGEAALMLSLAPNLSWSDLRDLVSAGSDEIYQYQGNQPYLGKLGSGRVNMLAGVEGPAAAGLARPDDLAQRLRIHPNPSTGRFHLSLVGSPRSDAPMLDIVDVTGRCVRTLSLHSQHGASWDGRDHSGRLLGAGVYYARLPSGEISHPLILLR
ncbi:MAG: S8 family serine peptidase [Candidatus Eisenbacteria bacterium]|nr:S8 family serine peptidase [Candidatus Eisenbacteria bacterium]